jgi:hypothetical protein
MSQTYQARPAASSGDPEGTSTNRRTSAWKHVKNFHNTKSDFFKAVAINANLKQLRLLNKIENVSITKKNLIICFSPVNLVVFFFDSVQIFHHLLRLGVKNRQSINL